MRAPIVSTVAVATLIIIITLLVVGSAVPSGGLVNGAGRTFRPASEPGRAAPEQSNSASPETAVSNALPSNPADCSQGSNTILVNPVPGDMHDTLLQDYDTLGAAGGGTLELGPGVFYVNESLDITRYGNVSIQGDGVGVTILSLPPSPIGSFKADNGTPVGLFNATTGGPDNGVSANFLQVWGSTPIDNFELCDLTLDAQANNASEDWSGSLIMDSSGGVHHVYSDIAEVGFFGPSTTPNGLHLESSPSGHSPGVGYVIDNLSASNNTVPFENYSNFRGGPNFLNVGAIAECTLDNVTGIGLVAFELAPPTGCTIQNWQVSGHVLVDPSTGGTWGGTLFQNVTIDTIGTPAPNALGISVANGTGQGGSNFTGLRWVDDHFDGTVLNGENLVDVENSTFYGQLNATPAIFDGNRVTWEALNPQGLALPIRTEGSPTGGAGSELSGNTFLFPNGTSKRDPFQLTVPDNTWWNDTLEISGATNGYVMNAPGVMISANSSFEAVTYDSMGNGSPADLVLFDITGSPGFEDLGAAVGPLTRVYNDLPLYVPTAPEELTGVAKSPTRVVLTWNASSGPLTNYTVWVGDVSGSYSLSYSVGLGTDYAVDALVPGAEHYFGVEAWNSSFHSSITGPIEVSTPPLPNPAPGLPTGLSVTTLAPSEVGLRWNPSTGNVTNYTVYVGTSATSLVPEFSTGVVTQFSATGLTPATAYFFAVEAWNGSFHSSVTSSVEATTWSGPAPGVPSGLSVASLGSSEVGLRWIPPGGNVTNYTVYFGTNLSALLSSVSAGGGSGYTVTGLNPATTYDFEIQAWNGSSPSGRSPAVNATTLPATVPSVAAPLSALDWLVLLGALVGAPGLVVMPLAIVSRTRSTARRRSAGRGSSRRAVTERS